MDVSPAQQRIYAGVERMLARRTDIILCNSQAEYDLAAGFGVPREKMRVVANGIGLTPPPVRKARSGPLRLGFIGRHDRQKGLDILLDVIARHGLDGLRFEIIGDKVLNDGGDSNFETVDGVTFHGWLPRSETLRLLHSFDALVMPSRWDAAPITATEAMRAGVPVIASNRGGLPEIVGDGVGGRVFDLDDRDGFARLLASLDRPMLERLGKGARKRFEQNYVSDKMDALTSGAYDFVLGNARIEAAPRQTDSNRSHALKRAVSR